MPHKPRAPRIQRHHFARAVLDGRTVDLLVADFSRSGMRIVEPTADIPAGSAVELEVTGEGSPAIRIAGTVIRRTGDGFAVRFDVATEDRPRWLEYQRNLARFEREA